MNRPEEHHVRGETALDGQRSLFILSPGARDGLSQQAMARPA